MHRLWYVVPLTQMISTHIHGLFGYALMAAGICRIIEICFVLHDRPTGEEPRGSEDTTWFKIHAFQYMPPFLLVVSGILFMSATDEEMHWADAKGVDHVTWGLIDFSVAFVLFLWMKYVAWLTQHSHRHLRRLRRAVRPRGRGFHRDAQRAACRNVDLRQPRCDTARDAAYPARRRVYSYGRL